MPQPPIAISIQEGDILEFPTDVVALKFAQGFYGVDDLVSRALMSRGVEVRRMQPGVGAHRLLDSEGALAAPRVLFVGVAPLWELDYSGISELSARALQVLAREAPDTRRLAMTIHGAGYGLDEGKALMAQVQGFYLAVQREWVGPEMTQVTLVEQDPGRVRRLWKTVEDAIRGYGSGETREVAAGLGNLAPGYE